MKISNKIQLTSKILKKFFALTTSNIYQFWTHDLIPHLLSHSCWLKGSWVLTRDVINFKQINPQNSIQGCRHFIFWAYNIVCYKTCPHEFSCDSLKLKRLRRNLLIGMSKQAFTLHLQSIRARFKLFPKCWL